MKNHVYSITTLICITQILQAQTWNYVGNDGLNAVAPAITLHEQDVYVGGEFTDAGGVAEADYLARWDGCTWHAVGPGLNGMVRAIEVVGEDIFVGGQFSSPFQFLARWDGEQWNPVGPGVPGQVLTMAMVGSDLIIGGGTQTPESGFVARWHDNAWEQLGPALNGRVNDIVILGNEIYACGSFTNVDGNSDAKGVIRWDGSNWQNLGTGISGFVWDLMVYEDTLYAGGAFSNTGGIMHASYVAKWDGSDWSALGNAHEFGGFLFSFNPLCAYQGAIYMAVGDGWGSSNGIYRFNTASHTWELFAGVEMELDYPMVRLACDDQNLYIGSTYYMCIEGSGCHSSIARWGMEEDCNTSDVEENAHEEHDGMVVYPNPTRSYVHYSLSDKLSDDTELQLHIVTLTNADGRVLVHKESEEWRLNLEHLPAGVYFLQIQNAGVRALAKIVLL